MTRCVTAVLLCACLAASIVGQAPISASGITYVANYTLPAGAIGGLVFDLLGATLYVGNASSGAVESYPVMRDPGTGQINGFGTPTIITFGGSPEGLDQYLGTWLWTNWPSNTLGQFNPTTGALAIADLTAAGVPPSTGGLRVVPAGWPTAGNCYVSSYDGGGIYQIPLNPDPSGNGTYLVPANSATLFAAVPTGAEGMAFIPSGPYAGSMLHSNYDSGDLAVVFLDAAGVPTGQQAVVTTGIPAAMGVVFDPLTGDFFVGVWAGGGNLHHFSGTIAGDYQLNQPGASFDVGGLQGGLLSPALTVAPAGAPLTIAWTSTNAGLPYDVALAPSLIPAGLVGPEGQIININLAATYTWVFGGTFGNAFAPASFIYGATGSSIAAQMGVVDPTKALGFAISQPNVIQ